MVWFLQETPCQPPAPRPPPMSLRPKADKPSVVSPVQEPVLTKVQQRSLVLPTALPPDICRESRGHFTTSLQHWNAAKQAYETWLGIWFVPLDLPLGFVGNCQLRKRFLQWFVSFCVTSVHQHWTFTLGLLQPPGTWMRHLGIDWQDLNLQFLVEILHLAKDASKHDVQANRLQPQYLLRGLRWLAKTALVNTWNPSLTMSWSAALSKVQELQKIVEKRCLYQFWFSFCGRMPWSPRWLQPGWSCSLAAFFWQPGGPSGLQICNALSSPPPNLVDNCLRGTCRMTKTTRSGQPFAVLLAGFTADTATSSWVFHWLRALHQATKKLSHFDPDFIIPTMDSLHSPTFSSPLSYAAALRALRWACQTPWDRPRLSSSSAQNFTLHSLKVSMLSVAAQLRLPHKDRQIQGHHTGGSVQLYSRDDTIDALWVQTQISTSVRLGWRPMRPQHRGGQAPLQDMPISHELPEFPSLLQLPHLADLGRFHAPDPVHRDTPVVFDLASSSESSSDESDDSSSSTTEPGIPNAQENLLFRQKWTSRMLPRSHSSTRRYTSGSPISFWRTWLGHPAVEPLWRSRLVQSSHPRFNDLAREKLAGLFLTICRSPLRSKTLVTACVFFFKFVFLSLAYSRLSASLDNSPLLFGRRVSEPEARLSREFFLTVSHSEPPFALKFGSIWCRLTLACSISFFGHRCAHFHSGSVSNDGQINTHFANFRQVIFFLISHWSRLDFPNFRHFTGFHASLFGLVFLSFLGSDDVHG